MQDYVFGLLSFICSLKGLSCSSWTMKVPEQVNGTLGQNVILPCIFTHPIQNTYTGHINVKWMQGNKQEPIFKCMLHNKTNAQNNCNYLKSSERLSLQAPAKILSLSLDLEVLGMMVKCIAQGNPLPEFKWTSSSGPLENVPIKTDHTNFIVISSVPHSEQDVYTCQTVNSLGQDQKTFPSNDSNCLGLKVTTGILGCLLLLGLVPFILDALKRRQSAQTSMLQDIGVQRVKPSIYHANEKIYANISTCPVGPEQGDVCSTGALREGGKVIPNTPKNRPPGPPPDTGEK
ncbi:sialic acid binding Ig-like lectin 15, like isoform X2 [Carassius gibelio]|uniref:sialic acid binding Ig-like lectin 15, like isoform X2 n=1 Tax=Carassius gibelio TaxID=101364 RepID=UPI00227828F6|nr:sialic acid binding Ig-like lectin 15, like isoform X2 [Carassius gibelio]